MNVHELTLQNYTAASGCPSACQPILYLGTAGSYGNEQINVVLGEGWQGLTVKAVFQPSGVPVVVPAGGGVISVPWEATQSVVAYPHGRISFQGYVSGRLVNTSDVPYTVGGSSAGTDNTPAPTPDEFQQFVDAVKADADRAEQAAADAEAAVQKVTNAGTQAVTDIGNAKDSALDAIAKAGEEAAGSLTADVQAAKDAAAAAAQSAKDAAAELPKVQQAGQTALDDIATERENSLTALEDEGNKQQSAVAGAGVSALEAIQQAGQSVTGQITQAGATQVGSVQSAGTTQVGLVNSAGQQQAENIAQAGSQQVQAVQTAGTAAVSTVNDARDDAVEEIETANAHAPQINSATGYWQTWDADTGKYVDTTTKAQGATPQLTIGTVTTLEPGEDATANITGTAEAPVLSFGIPEGEPGLGVPTPTANDYGKAPTVNAAGTGYELAGPYAPLSAAIRPIASGNPVSITDSVEWPLQGLRVYGKSTQDGTPSPENPVPIVSAGDGGSIGLIVSDGADQSQSLAISTPNGLPGIPVDSGGNYTDAEGQQWVCDYKDYKNEVYIKILTLIPDLSIGTFTTHANGMFICDLANYSAPNANSKILASMCTHFPTVDGQNLFGITVSNQYVIIGTALAETFDGVDDFNSLLREQSENNTPVQLLYYHNETTESPLSEEEIAAYRALHTYNGTTVVSTAEDVAGLEVKYVANAQKYIDNRLTAAESHIQEIAAAQLNAQTGG